MVSPDRPIVDLVPSGGDVRVDGVPSLRAFVRQAEEVTRDAGPTAFAELLPAFTELVRSPVLTELVNHELERLTRQPDSTPEGLRGRSQFDVAQTDAWRLSVRIARPFDAQGDGGVDGAGALWSSGEHVMIGLPSTAARDAGLEYDKYEQPHVEPCEVLDPGRPLLSRGRSVLQPDSVAVFRAGTDVVRFTGSTTGRALLVLTSAPVLAFRWGYDPATLRPTELAAANDEDWRLEYTMRLLADHGTADAVPTLSVLAAHRHHFIRWTAIRAVAALDLDAGVGLLGQALNDPHPDVRRAAQRALASLPAEENATA